MIVNMQKEQFDKLFQLVEWEDRAPQWGEFGGSFWDRVINQERNLLTFCQIDRNRYGIDGVGIVNNELILDISNLKTNEESKATLKSV